MRQRKLYGQRRASVTYARENFVANLAFAEISITPSPIVCCESFLQTLRKSRCARQELLLASASGQKCGRSERWNTGNSAIRGLKISALTMGTMTFGGKGNFAKVGNLQLDEVRKLIDIVADAGVNLIDTANVYSGGGSEDLIGEAMGHKRKSGMLIATKARFPMGEGPNDRGLSRWHLIRECEASLKRLRTDVIDLYQVHQWDGLTPLEETMEALDGLVRSGKVRYVGCSNWSGWHMMKAMEVARRDGRIPFVSEQIHYTLQAREAEYELLPIALDQKLAVLVWSPIAGGLLSGKHRRNKAAPEGTRQVAGWG